MTNEKVTEQNQTSLLSKRLSMHRQHQHDCGNNETPYSFFPLSIQRPTKIISPSSQIMNIKNSIPAIRPMSFDSSQSFIKNHFDLVNITPSNQQMDSNSSSYSTGQSTNFFEEPTVLKINIPIEMIVRTIPQQSTSSQPLQQSSSSSQEQWNHRCNHSTHSSPTTQTQCQTLSEWTSKPATSLIRKAQEVLFGANNDREDVVSNSIRRAGLPTFDLRLINDMNKSIASQQQQAHAKTLQKPLQVSQHQPTMSRSSDSSSSSYPVRCECGSTLYSSL